MKLRGPMASAWRWLRPAWPYLRYLAGLGVLALVVWMLSSHTDELSGLNSLFGRLHLWALLPAAAIEAASLASFARMQRELLRAGGVRPRLSSLFGLTLASQAIINSLPAGTAVASVYGFRWFRRFGADDTLAVWALVGTAVAATLSLALVAAAGVALAASYGASLDLIGVVAGVLVVTVLVGALFVYQRSLAVVVAWSLRAAKRLTGRPRADLETSINRVVERLTSVRLGWRQVAVIVGWGLANWMLDCSCFAFAFLAVGAPVPWNGLLLAYGAGQLAANLPITPGGLGAVEGSLTIALVAFGGERTGTVEAVLVYRLVSFWAVLAVGWLSAGWLAMSVRRGRWPRHPSAAPVPAVAVAPGLRPAKRWAAHEQDEGPR